MMQISRRDLYEKVWETPMELLAEEFGMTGRGLSKLCSRHEIPTPPRGYWAKVQAGQELRKSPLLKPQGRQPKMVTIRDNRPAKTGVKQRKEAERQAKAQLGAVIPAIQVPKNMRGLHWIVAQWLDEHKRTHAKARKEASERKRRDQNSTDIDKLFGWQLYWGPSDGEIDLTERDKYRFRMTSAFLKGLEANGGKAIEGKINGELKISCSGQVIKILVKEKMLQDRRKPSQREKDWTAYPGQHNAALRSSGFLRIHSKTSVGGGLKDQWIETDALSGGEFLASVIGDVLAMGPILVHRAEEAEVRRQQDLLAKQRRIEARRLAQLEAERWEGFKQLSNDWEEVQRLRRFLAEIQARPDDFAYEIEGMTVEEYIAWAGQKADEMDPFVKLDSHRRSDG